VFWLFITNFVIILYGRFLGKWLRGPYFIPAIGTFFLLGVVLIFLTIKERARGLQRKFLILSSASAIFFFVSVMLHNLFYGLAILTSNFTLLRYLMLCLNVVFFIVAVFVCPVLFLVGVIGNIALMLRKKFS